jgi:zinc/manganese transport system substrate-binding protein
MRRRTFVKRGLAALWLMLTGATALPASATDLDVVATSSAMGALVREVGGERVTLSVLAPPDRDLHRLQARPSMIRRLRGADLVVAVGAELEVGWLPVALSSAANPTILPGRPGYFEAAAQVDLLEAGRPADRSLGDVHPVGNPHLTLDPVRMSQVAVALAQRLAELDAAGADGYRARAADFAARADARTAAWRQRARGVDGVVLYHRDAIYLLDRLGVPLLGTIEPVPGVPPTARHLKDLADGLAGRSGRILYTVYQPSRPVESLAQRLGWPSARLPLDPPLEADGEGYLDHVGRWVDAIAGAE